MKKEQMPLSEPLGLENNISEEISSFNTVSMEYPVRKSLIDKNKKFFTVLAIIFGVVLILAGGYFLIRRRAGLTILSPFGGKDKLNVGGVGQKIVNPLTGVLHSEKDAEEWANERPIGYMVNNYIDARPHSNLSKADIVYEIVAEGGITRFLAFYLTNNPEKVGPIRSVREYYLVLAKELSDSMIMHWGYSPQAKFAIDTWPVRSLFVGGAGLDAYCPGCTWRDETKNVATEHTLYTDGVKLRERAVELGWEGRGDITMWKFKDDHQSYEDADKAETISIDFWYKGDYSGFFRFDPEKNVYSRYTGYNGEGAPIEHIDEDGTPVVSKNVIVQFAEEKGIVGDDSQRLEYTLVGSGEALIFLDGKVIKSTWVKEDRDLRTMFYDINGEEIMFNRGSFWIAIVPDRNVDQVVYQ